MRFHIMTLFPQVFEGYLNESIIKRAVEKGLIEIYLYNIRDFSKNKHKKVDDYPFGGGAGMVMTPQPIYDTYNYIIDKFNIKDPKVIYLTPKGKVYNQELAQDFSTDEDIILLCGHYEGIDQRIIDLIVTYEISIGDYVLTGGELPALILVDSISRLIPGVLGQEESFMEESFKDNLLEYPHYTRPREFMDQKVPDVLLSGNHKMIDEWRRQKSIEITARKRPDLIKKADLTDKDKKYIEKINKKH
ncbi:tRNA (guanosine(37)-N1)-methyltransferase TrmD [Tepidibacter formicigenes]|uniref:tRNA (guanine-N(1)-)-methyltransferase n=1 Tax=Tepidibacter formicigenes DSM 15518 TaxID=1123349 RepID=A0A1M6PVN9_9FIRM|nr:tRNA (guanosine(37)-N1)-methyltransferase TrmD [Tepidibacter formicigenes]SHK12034.1 tRNA (guanine37-N1)-methyltransferase [Tepidibacter formicigenes DSM 15518]